MARIIRFHDFGGPEVLRIEEIDPPRPGPGEVQIAVKALGLNRAEALMRAGRYIERPALPSGLGLEAAGIVTRVGDGVSGLAPGDAVSVVPPISQARYPAYGEAATFPAAHVVRHPAFLDWTTAAAVWMAYLTAYGALIDIARLGPGEAVAITAASSSVGLAAIQTANRVGATPIAVTRTSAKRQALLDAGAAHVVSIAEGGLDTRLAALSGADGLRLAFDAVGGPMVEPLAAALAPGGILIEYGGLSPEPTPFPLFTVLSKTLTLRGYLVHEIIRDAARLEAAKAFVLDGLAAGALRPVIARVFAFDEIVEAHRYLEAGDQLGKIVVTV
ncbi:NADPH:quinone reductase [Pleomorphomonas diazotrophica]|uniref:NADPH:quinone reductase n=1 Tax=Pleomorphomonas diazotrophica TaxID=1166257 RepID=A0A1I4W5D7_9HYPH|nr:zinc-dependent alcohol dehydrogenase family protein [Pleomorphomonas diazotrophica]PKR87890.1 NADPH:quinone reductase [Pleomorphomonas diazotrophica]SFN08771.1 NADPH:quinone reductase [Pleomorphomonas diazotrophica]